MMKIIITHKIMNFLEGLCQRKLGINILKSLSIHLNTINNISSLHHEEQKNYFNLARGKIY